MWGAFLATTSKLRCHGVLSAATGRAFFPSSHLHRRPPSRHMSPSEGVSAEVAQTTTVQRTFAARGCSRQVASQPQPPSEVSIPHAPGVNHIWTSRCPMGWKLLTAIDLADEERIKNDPTRTSFWPPMVPARPDHTSTCAAERPIGHPEGAGPVVNDGPSRRLANGVEEDHPFSATSSSSSPIVAARKSFLLGEYGQMYNWMGRVMAAADEFGLGDRVTTEWFFTEIRIDIDLRDRSPSVGGTQRHEEVLLPPQARDIVTEDRVIANSWKLACFMNESELLRGLKKNCQTATSVFGVKNKLDGAGSTSFDVASPSSSEITADTDTTLPRPSDQDHHHRQPVGVTPSSSSVLPADMSSRVKQKADETFCWCLVQDKKRRDTFAQDTFLQWMHRADYLVSRKSRQKKEFRNNLTLDQLLKDATTKRKRRQERRDNNTTGAGPRDGGRLAGTSPDASAAAALADSHIADVLPREVREQLDRDSDNPLDDLRHGTGSLNHSFRTNVF